MVMRWHMENFIIAAVIILVIGLAVAYIIREKKKGAVCIGCPYAGECAKKRQGGCEGITDTHQK